MQFLNMLLEAIVLRFYRIQEMHGLSINSLFHYYNSAKRPQVDVGNSDV